MATNTFREYKFPNGDTIKLTIAFKYLPLLKAKNKDIYERMNFCIINGAKDLYEAAMVVYGAYLCACLAGENGGIESAMTEEAFMDAIEDDALDIMIAGTALIDKKKN